MAKVLLADDSIEITDFLTVLLLINDFEVQNARTEAGVFEKLEQFKPDIILMDLVMEEMDGIEATKQLIKQWPEAKVIIVTSFLDDEKVYPALEAGATSYLLKTSKAGEIAAAIRRTYEGQSVLEPEVTGKMMSKMRKPSLPHEELTAREMEILLLMTQGKTNQEIADELFIALKTVKTHVSNLLSKLDVQDRTQAVIYAFKHKLAQ